MLLHVIPIDRRFILLPQSGKDGEAESTKPGNDQSCNQPDRPAWHTSFMFIPDSRNNLVEPCSPFGAEVRTKSSARSADSIVNYVFAFDCLLPAVPAVRTGSVPQK